TLVLIRAFTGALLGGLTSLGGAMAGGLLVGVVESHLQSRTSYPGAVEAALFAVIVAVLLLRPHGLFGRPEPVRPAPFAGGGRRLPRPRPLAGLAARRRALLGAGLVGTATVAAAASGEYWSFVAAVAATYAVVGISMFLLSGLAGQLSLGHAALMGLGGFTAALLTSRAGWPYPVTIPAAALVAAVGAAAIGVPAFRIRGLYLAVATLAFGIAAERRLFGLTAVSGAAVLARRGAATRGGSNLRVLHHDETLAASWGINTGRAKLFAFTLSGLLAGAAGGVYAGLVGHLTSEVFSAERSITLVAMAIVGGLGSVGGVVAGAVLFSLLPEVLHGAAQWLTLVDSAILLAVILLLPGGLAQLWTPAP